MNISRREAIAGTAALLGGFAMGKPTRGAVGAAGTNQKNAAAWVNPYITDGLVAMWDGEWNAGGGVHDPNATTWADLSGNGNDMAVTARGSFTGTCFEYVAKGSGELAQNMAAYADSVIDCNTLECACIVTGGNIVVSTGSGINSKNKTFLFSGSLSSGTRYTQFDSYHKYGPIDDSLPHTYCGVYGSAGASYVSAVYQDGVTIGIMSSTNAWGNRGGFSIGGGKSDGNYTSSGRVYCVRLYSRALSAAEIAANYAIDKQRFGL